ncbi:MAG: hypothetical protein IJ421_05780 [Prevotella sp.]|nr:hypothetical protein [Prevotella sp.]
MRRIFAVAIILLSYVIALAQERKPENDHVVVTMNDGTKVEGYVQKYWTDARLFKRVNYSFEMSPKPDGKNTMTYNAEQVESIEFVKKTDATGRYDRLESHDVANPSVMKPHKVKRQLVYVEYADSTGTVYWWNGYNSHDMQLGTLGISTIFGVKLKGDDVIIPFITGNVISLNAMRILYKKKDPGLVEYVDKKILKGRKDYWEHIVANPGLFLNLCEEYFAMKADNKDIINKKDK